MVSEKDLAKLPPRAVVAFAARCARRLQPLYRPPEEPKGYSGYARDVERAIEVAEAFAARTAPNDAADDAFAIDDADDAAVVSPADSNSARAARAAGYAARAAGYAAYHDFDGAARAASAASADIVLESAANLDYRKLLALKLGPDQSIDPTPSGPLGPYWANREPDWLRQTGAAKASVAASSRDKVAPRPDFAIAWDPSLLTPEQYAKLVTLVGDVVRAHGGLGVERIRSLGVSVPEGAAVLQ